MHTLSDELVVEALLAGDGLLAPAAQYISDRIGRQVARAELQDRVNGSRILRAAQQVAEQRSLERIIATGREARRRRRSAAMKASWARRHQAKVADDPQHFDALNEPNARVRARTSSGLRAALQRERDRTLCLAKTRAGHPCVRRVVPGKGRCKSHGGASTGPKTAAGKARVAAAQRARWQRYRKERTNHDGAAAPQSSTSHP
jgi:hypothetical protein